MARCFPFPPPDYSVMLSSDEALILSIKLQRANEMANLDRKKEVLSLDRTRKKYKKRDKEKKRQEGRSDKTVEGEKQKLVKEFYQDDKYKSALKGKCSLQGEESTLLEKSNITEEHGQPINAQNVSCSSSDSTGNSRKRKMPCTLASGTQNHGRIIRIRLPPSCKKGEPSTSGHEEQEVRLEPGTSGRKEQEVSLPTQKRDVPSASYCKVQPCSNMERAQSSIKGKDVNVNTQHCFNFASASDATFQPASVQNSNVPCLSEKKIKSAVPKEKLSSHEKKMRKKESQYEQLFESWVPPALQSEAVVDHGDDEDWLFGSKGEKNLIAKSLKVNDIDRSKKNLPCCASAVMQPRAQFLPDASVYALPFTVPF